MKKKIFSILLLFASFCISTVNARDSVPSELEGTVIEQRQSNKGLKRLPGRANIILCIGEESISVIFNGDYGCGSYELMTLSSGVSSTGTINTSYDNMLLIPIQDPCSSSLDFIIEFEDGSWCHIIY